MDDPQNVPSEKASNGLKGKTKPKSAFLNLPVDVVHEIADKLDVFSARSLSGTCRDMRAVLGTRTLQNLREVPELIEREIGMWQAYPDDFLRTYCDRFHKRETNEDGSLITWNEFFVNRAKYLVHGGSAYPADCQALTAGRLDMDPVSRRPYYNYEVARMVYRAQLLGPDYGLSLEFFEGCSRAGCWDWDNSERKEYWYNYTEAKIINDRLVLKVEGLFSHCIPINKDINPVYFFYSRDSIRQPTSRVPFLMYLTDPDRLTKEEDTRFKLDFLAMQTARWEKGTYWERDSICGHLNPVVLAAETRAYPPELSVAIRTDPTTAILPTAVDNELLSCPNCHCTYCFRVTDYKNLDHPLFWAMIDARKCQPDMLYVTSTSWVDLGICLPRPSHQFANIFCFSRVDGVTPFMAEMRRTHNINLSTLPNLQELYSDAEDFDELCLMLEHCSLHSHDEAVVELERCSLCSHAEEIDELCLMLEHCSLSP